MISRELKTALGQCLCVGFEGTQVPQEYIDLIREYKVGNVLLFRRNVESYAQLKALNTALKEEILRETGQEPFIMIDEECGRVTRIGHIAALTPSAMAIGATDSEDNAYAVGRLIGEELSAAGVNMDLAPVLDCYLNPANAVGGNRDFAREPEKVAALGKAYTRGLHQSGVMACGKHFPGHGDTAVDSHLALPIVEKSLEQMRREDLKPFQEAIDDGIDAIMSAHVVFPQVDENRVPCTVSRRVMTGLLREEMGFEGIIISDGMEMRAVMDLYGVEEGVLLALKAGVDIALVCHSPAQARATCEHIYRAVAEGRITQEEIFAHCRRITAAKARLQGPQGGEELFGNAAQKAEAARIMDEAIRFYHRPEDTFPELNGKTVYFGVPVNRVSLVQDDEEPLNAAKCLAEAFGGRFAANPPSGADVAVVCLANHPDAEKVKAQALRLAAEGTRVIAVSLFTPYCFEGLPDSVFKIAAWQYDTLAITSLIKFIRAQKA